MGTCFVIIASTALPTFFTRFKVLCSPGYTNRYQWRKFQFEDPHILNITVQNFAARAICHSGFVLSCYTTFLVLTCYSFCYKYIIKVFLASRYLTTVCKNSFMNSLGIYETSVAINRFSVPEYSNFSQPRGVTVLRNIAVGRLALREIRVGEGGDCVSFNVHVDLPCLYKGKLTLDTPWKHGVGEAKCNTFLTPAVNEGAFGVKLILGVKIDCFAPAGNMGVL